MRTKITRLAVEHAIQMYVNQSGKMPTCIHGDYAVLREVADLADAVMTGLGQVVYQTPLGGLRLCLEPRSGDVWWVDGD